MRELVRAARARGDDLTGPKGLLKVITKQAIQHRVQLVGLALSVFAAWDGGFDDPVPSCFEHVSHHR